MNALRVIFICSFLIIASFEASFAQVLLDDFDRSNSTGVGNGWTEIENYGAANGAGAFIASNELQLQNCTSQGVTGRTFIYQNISSNYLATFNTNPCIMTWAFNLRQTSSTADGFSLGHFGAAYVLGSTTSNFENTGNGYAVLVGGSTAATTDKLRLVKFSAGLGSDLFITDIITPTSITLNRYYSYIVTYNPSGDKWQLFYRNDGNTSFQDPAPASGTDTYTSSPTKSDNSYTSSSLPYSGCYYNFDKNPVNKHALFDNIYIPSGTPVITPSGSTTICSAGSLSLTSSTGSSYLWSNGATTQTINVTSAGSYTVTVSDANGCQRTSAPIAVTVIPSPSVPVISAGGATTFCEGGSVSLTSSTATSYLWSNGASTQSLNVTASGSYSVTVTGANGCQRTSSSTSITVNPLPVATITADNPTTFCTGGSVNLTSSAASSYLWSNGATTNSINVTASGSYSVIVTNSNGCQATSAAKIITVNSLPAVPTITADGATTFCAGGSVNLTSNAAASYLWSNGTTSQTVSASTSGSYTVTVSDANGCQRTSAPTTVTVNSLPAVPTITADGATIFCAGGSVTLTSSSASSYLWSDGTSNQTTSANTSGSYTVTVSDANGCQRTSAPTTVTVNSLPAVPTITADGATTFCAGGSVNLTSNAATSYLWTGGTTTQTISVTASGSYTVTVSDANGCQRTSAPIIIVNNPLPLANITANGPVSFCSSESVNLTVSSASAYLWSNGATTQTITTNTGGSYSVTVTNSNGCQATSDPTVVVINPCTFTWTGSLSSEWNTAGNWDKGSVPLANDDVIIPSGTLNSPVITGTIAYRTLTINAAAGFTVNSGALLNTSGDLNNNSTLTNMGGTISFIGSSVQNISGAINFNHIIVNNGSGVVLNNTTKVSGNIRLLNGSLVSNGNLNLILSTGSIEYNASDNGGISGNMMITKSIPSIKTHYLSSPLNGSTTGDFYDDVQVINPANGLTRLATWNVSTQAWVASYGTSTPLNVLNGYSIFFPTTPTVLDFTGTYSHKAVPSVLDYTNVVANNYILVGNPYPATLDWNIVSGWVKTNINNAIYLWDGKNTRYASYVNGTGTNGGTQYIPSMQAFYVTAAAGGTASIGVNNDARVTNPNPGLWRVGADDNILKLSLSSAGYTDETIIKFSENASDEFDGDLDALKLKNPDLAPSFYSVSGKDDYSINTLSPGDKTIPLNVEAGFAGTYTINHENETSNTDYSLILEDKLLKTFTDLKTEDYTFSVNPGQGNNRFSLAYRTGNATPTMGSTIPSVSISSNEKTINISYSNLIEGSYSLYNSIGQLISSETLNTTSGQYSNRPANIQPGIYIVKVLGDGKVYSSKVYLGE